MTTSRKISLIMMLMMVFHGIYGEGFMGGLAINEKNGDVIITMNVPRMEEDNIHVRIERGQLHVWASKEKKEEIAKKNYYEKEVERGSFDRMITLPSGIDTDAMEWEVKNGVLTVTIPKIEE